MKRPQSRGRSIAAALAMVLLLGGVSAAPAMGVAYSTFTPYFVEAPQYVLDDHTGFGVRTSVNTGSGIPDGTYYLRLVLADTDSPATWTESSLRGFTYNEATDKWVPYTGPAAELPTVTVYSSGTLDQGWFYGKVGDETQSGSFHLNIVLTAVDGGAVYHSMAPSLGVLNPITVLDSETVGSWLHNGTTLDPTLTGKRVAVRAPDASTGNGDPQFPNKKTPALVPSSLLYSLWEMQANAVDDDANGVVNDENYGPSDTSASDYRVGVPAVASVDLYIHRDTQLEAGFLVNDYTTGAADCDIAVGAANEVAPERVTGLVATASATAIDLTWNEADDDAGAASYLVYRWATGSSSRTTPNPVLVARVPAGTFSYTDNSFVHGQEYAYHVRAADTSTNVGPRSATATVKAPAPVTLLPVYRFFNVTNNTHFFTASAEERAIVLAKWPHIYKEESPTYSVNPANNTAPLYRFYNKVSQSHFYTADAKERAIVNATWPDVFTDEGAVYNVSATQVPNSIPVYRFYNRVTRSHFYTASAAERDIVNATWPHIFTDENVGFYAGQ